MSIQHLKSEIAQRELSDLVRKSYSASASLTIIRED